MDREVLNMLPNVGYLSNIGSIYYCCNSSSRGSLGNLCTIHGKCIPVVVVATVASSYSPTLIAGCVHAQTETKFTSIFLFYGGWHFRDSAAIVVDLKSMEYRQIATEESLDVQERPQELGDDGWVVDFRPGVDAIAFPCWQAGL